ncbi:MAG TPA: DUF3784 domain-containing protein [Flavobacteriaceae bacterium]|nr:DUF3784 domain-containing protein [Flavobacteriaceae bacterium]
MIYLLAGMSVLFIAIGFILTENNAKYILSGYNTLSQEDRKKVDIQNYVPFFRRFHLFLGISLFVFGILLTYFIHINVGGIFVAVYPILAYIYFALTSSKFSRELESKNDKYAIVILVGVLIFMVGLLGYGFTENRLIIDSQKLILQGNYGETLTPNQIKSIQLVNELPEISLKMNGFALGTVKKGYFRTREGEKVKLILNKANKPYLFIAKANGQKIYYSPQNGWNEKMLEILKNFKSLEFP